MPKVGCLARSRVTAIPRFAYAPPAQLQKRSSLRSLALEPETKLTLCGFARYNTKSLQKNTTGYLLVSRCICRRTLRLAMNGTVRNSGKIQHFAVNCSTVQKALLFSCLRSAWSNLPTKLRLVSVLYPQTINKLKRPPLWWSF